MSRVSWTPPVDREGPAPRDLADASVWQAAGRILADRHGLAADELVPFESGSDVVLGTSATVVKLSAPRWAGQMRREIDFLEHVADRLDVRTPEVVAQGNLDGWPYLIMTRLPGRAIGDVWDDLVAADRQRLAAEIGELCAELHALPLPETDEAWEPFLAEQRRTVVARQRDHGVDEVWLDRIEPFLDSVALPARRSVLLHTEVLDQHLLVENVAGQATITGMIDLADGRVGHPDYEWAAPAEFIFRGERGLLGRMLRAYGWSASEGGVDGGRRLAAWALLHRYGNLTRAMSLVMPGAVNDFAELAAQIYDPDPA